MAALDNSKCITYGELVDNLRLYYDGSYLHLKFSDDVTLSSIPFKITYIVTTDLEHSSLSNFDSVVLNGGKYTTRIISDTYYDIDTVTVTMGDTDITSSVYDADEGMVSISAVTGDINIKVVSKFARYSVAISGQTNIISTNTDMAVTAMNSWTTTLTAPDGFTYTLDSITMGGEEITPVITNITRYDGTNNLKTETFTIEDASGDIVIAITEIRICAISTDLDNATIDNDTAMLLYGQSYSATLTPTSPYVFHDGEVIIKVGGTDVTSEVYDADTHTITIASLEGMLEIYAHATHEDLNVTLNVNGVVMSNTATTTPYAATYTNTILYYNSYTLDTLLITMGGSDVTNTYFNNGTIEIPLVSADIEITITAHVNEIGYVDNTDNDVVINDGILDDGTYTLKYETDTDDSVDSYRDIDTIVIS